MNFAFIGDPGGRCLWPASLAEWFPSRGPSFPRPPHVYTPRTPMHQLTRMAACGHAWTLHCQRRMCSDDVNKPVTTRFNVIRGQEREDAFGAQWSTSVRSFGSGPYCTLAFTVFYLSGRRENTLRTHFTATLNHELPSFEWHSSPGSSVLSETPQLFLYFAP